MRTSRTVINEAVINVRRASEKKADFGTKDYLNLPKITDLKNYMAEITQEFYKQRRMKLGREYSISSIEKVYEASVEKPRYIFLIKVKALSTTLKFSKVIGYQSLKPLRNPSKYYELRFLMYIDLTNYLLKPTITHLKADLSTATCYYDCNCMSFHYHGIRYRAKKWAIYPTNIVDQVQRAKFGMMSRVCKHIGAFSTDFMGFASQLKTQIDKAMEN
jgi:hypothetical protein